MLILGTGAFLWLSEGGTASLVGGPFTLQDGNGKQVTDRDFRGKYMLVYFGYTFCPDVCPTTLNEVADALDRLGPKADRLQPIFITVDPKRDTPAVVQAVRRRLHAPAAWPDRHPEQIAEVAQEYRVYYAEHRTGSGPNDYTDGSQLDPVSDGARREVHRADPRRRGRRQDGGRPGQADVLTTERER